MSDVLNRSNGHLTFAWAKPKKSTLNPGVPAASRIIRIPGSLFEGYCSFSQAMTPAKELLYVLFMLCVAMHPDAPKMFGIDSFDHAMNPRLARRITQVFSRLILESGLTWFLWTTHNPLVLDGSDLTDERIRLFATTGMRTDI